MIKKVVCLLTFIATAILSYAQTSQPKIQVEFQGNKTFSSDTLSNKLNDCLAKYSNSENTRADKILDYCLQREVKGFLQGEGYLNATVKSLKNQEDEQNPKIVVSIVEERIYRLGRINIKGAKAFTPEQLLEKLNLKAGDVVNDQELRQWLFGRLKDLYGDNGYIQSSFDLELKFKPVKNDENNGIVDLEVTVDEGERFTIGRIEFAGNKKTPDNVLRSLVLIKEDENFSQKRFEEGIEKLNESGLFERIDKDTDVRFISDTESSLLKLIVHVKEKLL